MKHRDDEISPHLRKLMNDLAKQLDTTFNGDATGLDRKNGFMLLVFPFDEVSGKGRSNYISNASRADMIVMLKELVRRFEGQPEIKGGTRQ